MDPTALLRLLQLASPALPVGAYTYSEGLETLVHQGIIQTATQLESWLVQELSLGAARLEGAIVTRAYQASQAQDFDCLQTWNAWYLASRETEELRLQTLQMGRSLTKLAQDLSPALSPALNSGPTPNPIPNPSPPSPGTTKVPQSFPIAYGHTAAQWQIPLAEALLGYLSSWATNLINAGIKLIPLGQTAGQKLLLRLDPHLRQGAQQAMALPDSDLVVCGWGLALASMEHETQYSRLFRS